MLGDGKRGAMEINNCMADFALVAIRRRGELVVVRVFVAIAASAKFYLVDGVLACGNVALRALHRNVFALQRIF